MDKAGDMKGSRSAPLLCVTRGDYVDAVHHGHIAIVRSDGFICASAGEHAYAAVLRSGMKPIQVLSVIASGAVEKFGLTDEELAVAAASHSGEEEHLAAVRSILNKIGKSEADLRCGVHAPFMPHVAARMAGAGEEPCQLNNNCSGKHAAMLAACLAKGWPVQGYDRLEHPLQQDILLRLARFAGVEAKEIGIVVDGCGIPAFVLPLWRSALVFARLADPGAAPEEDRKLVGIAVKAITANPTYGSGKVGRLEALLMQIGEGKLIAKVGAEGFYAVGVTPGVIGRTGFGLALKLEEGITFNRATDPIVVAALEQIGVLSEAQAGRLADFKAREVLNCRGESVGGMKALFRLAIGDH
ncbi:MAG TPA: asparaginase [Acidobacteriota bacterium]|nr:asparaginase [Acidobacteriota bacterium]